MSEAAAPSLRLDRLTLTDFRNYPTLHWRPDAPITAIFGPNGSGKTNLLEAVSLLAPGRGLRGARPAELARHGAGRWAVAARLETGGGTVDIGTGTPPDGPVDRRVFRLDGAAPRNQSEVASRVAAVWLTPQMDRLFGEAAGGRRRFLDRLVWALEPSHAREVAAHDTAVAGRNRLLAQGGADPAWLAGVEDQIARHAVAAAAARRSLVAALNEAAGDEDAAEGFPAVRMRLSCPVADRLAEGTALAAEDWLRAELLRARGRDAAAGATGLGAHRADMGLAEAASGLDAAQASTGQQKTLLIGVVLAHAALLTRARGYAPLLLLDEPLVHLDADRRRRLFAALRALPAQAILTGTDAESFRPLAGTASLLELRDGRLET